MTGRVRWDARPDARQFPNLPAGPLAAVITREIVRVRSSDDAPYEVGTQAKHDTVETVCERLGITARSYSAWRNGERASVQFDVADRVLVHLGLLYFDVWPGDAKVQRAFEGDGTMDLAA